MELLIYCGHTIHAQARSGVQRVVIEASKALMARANISLVKWDEMDGQLRYLDERDIRKLFGDSANASQLLNPCCHRVAYRFGDIVKSPHSSWLLFPEIPYHLPAGNEIFARIISQCREYGIRTAAIFYDLIPVRDDDYRTARAEHIAYMTELPLCDLVFPISHFAGNDLLDFFASLGTLTETQLADIRSRVIATPLGENREGEPWGNPLPVSGRPDDPVMVMVGTVEPRKQQTRLLKVLNDACHEHPELRRLKVEVFGSLHPSSAGELSTQISRNPKISFHHYGSEEQIDEAYRSAWFTAFPSRHEGYGLPIVESLRRGIPCITSNFGAMAEIASGGGCLTVDSMNDRALADALLQMISDTELRHRLGAEISSRPSRSWGDYAGDILATIQKVNAREKAAEQDFRSWLDASLDDNLTGTAGSMLGGIQWGIVKVRAEDTSKPIPEHQPADRSSGRFAVITRLAGNTAGSNLSRSQLAAIADADVLFLNDRHDMQAVVKAANSLDLAVPLPHSIFYGEDGTTAAIEAAIGMSRERGVARLAAEREQLRADMLSRLRNELPHGQCDLAILISTFNRGPFVEMNVGWLLRTIEAAGLNVRCIVVDNTSTDDTYDRLSKFLGHRSFTYVCNSANVGMLGNLKVSSALNAAKYVWLTGDDDFIVPGAIERTLAAITEHPGVPFLFHNFEVYHREKLGSRDSPDIFMREAQTMAKTPRPAGLYPVNQIADEHDNLFTAIYPIVFRSDILAACFNYPFDGIPFDNLVESVPTSKIILGHYRYCKAYWFDQPGIAGNAHNSWAAHRPRWHLVLMPEVLDLARDAGVNPQKVRDWTKIHLDLFNDAVRIAVNRKQVAHLSIPGDTDNAFRVFRESAGIPKDLRVVSCPPPPFWKNP